MEGWKGITKGKDDAGSEEDARGTEVGRGEEAQDTLYARHVEISPTYHFLEVCNRGKGRMAGRSGTVEVRFYKESRVLGCEGWR